MQTKVPVTLATSELKAGGSASPQIGAGIEVAGHEEPIRAGEAVYK